MTVADNYYDYSRGWENTNPGWYEVKLNWITNNKHKQVIEWMYNNLDNCEKHSRWIWNEEYSCFKFRHERDYIIFTLRWS